VHLTDVAVATVRLGARAGKGRLSLRPVESAGRPRGPGLEGAGVSAMRRGLGRATSKGWLGTLVATAICAAIAFGLPAIDRSVDAGDLIEPGTVIELSGDVTFEAPAWWSIDEDASTRGEVIVLRSEVADLTVSAEHGASGPRLEAVTVLERLVERTGGRTVVTIGLVETFQGLPAATVRIRLDGAGRRLAVVVDADLGTTVILDGGMRSGAMAFEVDQELLVTLRTVTVGDA
jgi:hypothetical protein